MPGEPTPDAATSGPPRPGCWGLSGKLAVGVLLGLGALYLLRPPPLGHPRWESRRHETQNRLKQLGLALYNYHSSSGGGDDTAAGRFPPPPGDADAATPPVGWLTALLPFVDEGDLRRRYDAAAAYDDPANAAAVALPVQPYLTPTDGWRDRRTEGGFGLAHYAGNVRVLGPGGAGRIPGLRDGMVNTLMAGQIDGFPRPWADPDHFRDPAAGLGSGPRQFGTPFRHGDVPSGKMVMGDGSVRTVSVAIDPAVLAALGTPDGGEEVSADAW